MRYLLSTISCLIILLGYSELMAQVRSSGNMDSIANSWCQIYSARRAPGSRAIEAVASSGARLIAKSSTLGMVNADDEIFAVYAPNSGDGYVIVSARYSQPEVLGYSSVGTFDMNQMPPAMVDYLRCTALNASKEHLNIQTENAIEPLLGNIQFNQTAPYNNMCPVINGIPTYTGCVPTSMAQIMTYYRYPDQMLGDTIIYYTTGTDSIFVQLNPSDVSFDWGNIIPQYGKAATPKNEKESLSASSYMGARSMRIDDNGSVYLDSLDNFYTGTFNGDLQLLLMTTDGTFLRSIGSPTNITNFRTRYHYRSISCLMGMPSDIPNGNYLIYAGVKFSSTDQWYKVKHISAKFVPLSTAPYLMVNVKDGRYIIDGKEFLVDYTEDQAKAVALLNFACGVVCHADYDTASTSGNQFLGTQAMVENFGYDDGIYDIYASSYPSVSALENDIITELQTQRPLAASGSSGVSGHRYIIDGYQIYDSLPYFHFNWGWGGHNDGYFLLNYEHSSNENQVNTYAYDLDICFGIKPDDGIESPAVFTCDTFNVDRTECLSGETVYVSVKKLLNNTVRTFSGSFSISLLSQDDGEKFNLAILPHSEIKFRWSKNYNSKKIVIPNEIPTGNYILQIKTISDSGIIGGVITRSSPEIRIGNKSSGIECIYDNKQESGFVYTIDGQRVGVEHLKRGFYIKSGRTYFVR